MKKFYILFLVFFSLFVAVSCSKEVDNPVSPKLATLTIKSAKPQLDLETRTEWDGSSIVWSTGDVIRVGYTFDGDWMAASSAGTAKFYASDPVSIDGNNSSIGTFAVPTGFTSPGKGKYMFYAVSPSSLLSSTDVADAPNVTFALLATQTPNQSSFDSKADVMIGSSEEDELEDFPETVDINWKRIVAHADLTFSNMAFDGSEKITTVTLTANEGAALAGSFSVDITDCSYSAVDATNTIVLNGDKLISESNSFEVWASMMPETITALDVVVKTDKATYTRNITGISKTFKQNARNRLTINMSNAVRIVDTPVQYSLFSGDLVEDDYIVYYDGKALKAEVSSNRLQYAEVAPSDNVISTNNTAIVWHIAKSGDYWTIYNAEEAMYAASTGVKNQAQLLADGTDDKALWTVSGTSTYDFVNKANIAANVNAYLRNNSTYGFACYAASTGGALSLYRKGISSGIAFAKDSYTLTIGTEDYTAFTGQSLTNPNSVSVTYSSSDDAIATVASDGTVTLTGEAGEVTITASFAGNETYFEGAASYTIAVIEGYDFETVAELNALVTETSSSYVGYLTDAVVSFVPADNVAIIKDKTGSITYFKSSHGLKQGQTFTGEITVKAVLYNNSYSEITELDARFTGDQSNVDPESVALSSLIGNYSTYQNAFVSLSGLEVTAVSSKNVNVTDGTNTYVVFFNPGNATCNVGSLITAVGTITKYSTTEELKVWSEEDLSIDETGPTITKTDISDVSADGVTNATTSISLADAEGWTASVTPDGTIVTAASITGSTITYSVSANTGSARTGSISVTLTKTGHNAVVTATISVGQKASSSSTTQEYTDILNQSWTGSTGTSYTNWSNKEGSNSTAIYAGNSAGGNSSIQFRSNNNNSGIVSTTSGGKVKKVVVTWNSSTTSGRTLNIYGSNTAYSSAADLYGDNSGTLIGTIVCGTSTELTVTGEYTYIGLRSSSGAMYLTEVDITWEK